MNRFRPEIIKKISNKLGKSEKYVGEQISKRARRENTSSEIALAKWAKELKIPITWYLRSLSSSQQAQIYSPQLPFINNGEIARAQTLRIIQIGKSEDALYNNGWVQIVVVGIGAGTIAQVLGNLFSKLFGIT